MPQSNKELLQITKDLIDTNVGGMVEPADAEEFIDLAVDQTDVLAIISVMTSIRKKQNVDTISIGEPVIRKRTEGQDTADEDISDVNSDRKTLDPVEFSAYFDVTFQWLRRNIMGDLNRENWDRALQKLNDLFAKRIGKDAVLVLFSGDTSNSGTTAKDKALKLFDGFVTLAEADSTVHDYTIPADPTWAGSGAVFSEMIKLLPKDYRDERDQLAFFVSNNVLDDYEDEIADRETAAADAVMFGSSEVNTYKRIKIIPVYGFPDDTVILTLTANLYAGWGVQMETFNEVKPRKKGGCIEVTINSELDAAYAVGDALVLGKKA
jgi:hypothetical protein